MLEDIPLVNPDVEFDHYVYGTGMPNTEGLRSALIKMGCKPDGPRKVMWTSLREVGHFLLSETHADNNRSPFL